MYSLKALAIKLGGHVHGDNLVMINRLATLKNAKKGQLSFLANSKYTNDLRKTKASAVILTKDSLALCPTNAIVVDNPYLGFAKAAKFFNQEPPNLTGIHDSATVANSSIISNNAYIGANVVIGENVCISDNAIIGANCVIMDNSHIGKKTEIKPNVTIYRNVIIGSYCIIHANSVIGSDGFGNAKDEQNNWVKIPQIGGVTIGNFVEIGASTSIDRGTIDNTVISNGVKIDNQVQIAHNVSIGENTAIAGLTGIAGSTVIGKNCLLGGQVGISGHLKICDGVLLAAASHVSKNITKSGYYTASFNSRPHMTWKRAIARIFRLDKLESRVKMLEKNAKNLNKQS